MTTPARLPDVGFETFAALDLRVGRVVTVTSFPEARIPAFKIVVDFGDLGELRTSAQVTNYTAPEFVGRLVIGAINLGTKRIAGFDSQFLLLGSIGEGGVISLLYPDDGARPGDRVA